ESDQPDAPARLDRAPADDGQRLGRGDRAEGAACAPEHRRAEIGEEENAAVALVTEGADMRHTGACGRVVVDMADVVAFGKNADVDRLEATPAPLGDEA